jgi:hypothetical protein
LAVRELEERRSRDRFTVDGAAICGELDVGALAELARRAAAFNAAVERAKRRPAGGDPGRPASPPGPAVENVTPCKRTTPCKVCGNAAPEAS